MNAPTTSRRWFLPAALAVSTTTGFLDRLNLSVALPTIAHDFGWTTEQIGSYGGFLLAAFFLGYGLSNVFVTPLAARLGPRKALLVIVLTFSTVSILTGPLSRSLAVFIGMRVLLGLGEGPHFPMMSTVTRHWFPPGERSRANAIWVLGAVVATMATPLVVVPIISAFGWRAMFVVLGLAGLCLTFPAMLLAVYDTPKDARWLPAAEAREIAALDEASTQGEPTGKGWRFLRTWRFWLIVVAGSLNNFCVYAIMSWLPTYFAEGRHLDFKELRWAASFPYFTTLVGILVAAWLGDRLGKRALIAAVGYVATAIAVYLATAAVSTAATIAFFAVAVFFMSWYSGQEFAMLQHLVPKEHISRGTGVYNGIGVLLGGVGGSVAVGAVVSASGSYRAGILTVVVVAALTSVLLFAIARIEATSSVSREEKAPS